MGEGRRGEGETLCILLHTTYICITMTDFTNTLYFGDNFNKQLPSAKTPNEQTRLQREIDATDDMIDKLVYELYGLTEEEVKVVEGA